MPSDSLPDTRLSRAAAVGGWLAVLSVLGCIQFVVTRSCGYELVPPLTYAVYFSLHVYLPGVVAMHALNRGPISITTSIALGVPTGFALEIFSFLGLAAMGAKGLMAALPVVWIAGGAFLCRRRREWPVRWRMTGRHTGIALGLGVLFLATTIAAVSHMFAESPLVEGLPQRPIFHDWVYLVSRAAAIKNLWPLEDPSLAGVPLQYHYFMLVHAASVSSVTGLEITLVLLRLMVVPLGIVLVVQAFALGRWVSRTPWGGVLAALLIVTASEMAFVAQANESVFLGRFVRWLFVSPTFYFGMIYFGALLLAMARWCELPRPELARHLAWLCLLAAAATGAKGTVMPVLLPAVAMWAAWRWLRSGRFPSRLAIAGTCLGVVFAVVYQITMAGWGTGAATFAPFDLFRASIFWMQQLPRWESGLAEWLPPAAGASIAALACAAVVVAGTLGVGLLAVPYLLIKAGRGREPVVELLGFAFLCSGAMGMLMRLDAHGELYLFLLIQVPAAVLAAAFLVRAIRAWAGTANETARLHQAVTETSDARVGVGHGWRRRAAPLFAAGVIGLALSVQIGVWVLRNRIGFVEWLRPVHGAKVHENMRLLQEAMRWVRVHTERDALLIANAHTPSNRQKDHWGALDGTLAGVHYYYSAFSERRLLVEGPNYLLDPQRVMERMERAAEIFHHRRSPSADLFGSMPCYALIDRSIGDGAALDLPDAARVFANGRIEIHRLPRTPIPAGVTALVARTP